MSLLKKTLQAKINPSYGKLNCGHPSKHLSVKLCDGIYCLTLPSEEVPATCPVAMVILSGWTAKLQGAGGRPKGQWLTVLKNVRKVHHKNCYNSHDMIKFKILDGQF